MEEELQKILNIINDFNKTHKTQIKGLNINEIDTILDITKYTVSLELEYL